MKKRVGGIMEKIMGTEYPIMVRIPEMRRNESGIDIE